MLPQYPVPQEHFVKSCQQNEGGYDLDSGNRETEIPYLVCKLLAVVAIQSQLEQIASNFVLW